VKAKVLKVCAKGYISDGQVNSPTGYFRVPKGLDDIRMVYDGMRSGLNTALWAPNFGLPTVDTFL